jgi:hypothetical protein
MAILLLSWQATFGQNWEKYKAEDLAFVAYYPKAPERSVKKVPIASGEMDMHVVNYSPKADDDNLLYAIIRSDYPEDQFKNADEEYNNEKLDTAVKGAVTNMKGKLVYENKVKFNGYPGRNIKIAVKGGFIYLNAYLMDNTMFITQVICLTAKDENPSIQRFLDSFEIIKVK